MSTIITRAAKGSALTHNEVDANFTNLNTDKLDTAGIALGSAASPTIKFTGDTNTGLYSPGADQVALSTGGTERLRITSAGLVGIGTSSPNALLTVGAGNVTASSAKAIFNTGDAAATPAITVSNWIGSATTNGPRILFDNSTRGAFEIGGANGTHAFVVVDAQVPAERLRIDSSGNVGIADAGNITVGTTTGTKIGTATTEKLGFYNKTPVVQPAAVANATDAASVITQLNALLARMRDLGLIAT